MFETAERRTERVVRRLLDPDDRTALVVGAALSGTSALLTRVLDRVRAGGDRAFVFDPAGEFLGRYYRDGIDVVCNPLDARSPAWEPLAEPGADPESLAMCVAQGCARGADSEAGIDLAARTLATVFAASGGSSALAGEATHRAALTPRVAYRGGVVAGHFGDAARTQDVAGAILARAARALRLSAATLDGDAATWSVSEWASNGRGWLFMTARGEAWQSIKPLVAVALDRVTAIEPKCRTVIHAAESMPRFPGASALLAGSARRATIVTVSSIGLLQRANSNATRRLIATARLEAVFATACTESDGFVRARVGSADVPPLDALPDGVAVLPTDRGFRTHALRVAGQPDLRRSFVARCARSSTELAPPRS